VGGRDDGATKIITTNTTATTATAGKSSAAAAPVQVTLAPHADQIFPRIPGEQKQQALHLPALMHIKNRTTTIFCSNSRNS
jgi:hypothetical protein